LMKSLSLSRGRVSGICCLSGRSLKKDHLLRFPHPTSLRRTPKYASLLRISGLPKTGFRKAQLASACLREAASAKAGPFLSNLEQILFSKAFSAKDKEPSLRDFLLTQLGPFLHFSLGFTRPKKGAKRRPPLGFFDVPYFLGGNRRLMVFSEGGLVMKLTPK